MFGPHGAQQHLATPREFLRGEMHCHRREPIAAGSEPQPVGAGLHNGPSGFKLRQGASGAAQICGSPSRPLGGSMDGSTIFAFALVLFVVVTLAAGIRQVPQGYHFTVERFRKYNRTLTPGSGSGW